MATHIHIQELGDGLRIQAHHDLPHWERLLVTGFIGMFAGVVGASLLDGWWWTILSVVAAGIAYRTASSTSAELQVTKLEFVSKGYFGRRDNTPRTVCTGDVRMLEFRAESRLLNTVRHGLYALTGRKEICLLPFLEWEQAEEIIRAIENKFPGLAEAWRANSPSKT
jgi:hypothetical protein